MTGFFGYVSTSTSANNNITFSEFIDSDLNLIQEEIEINSPIMTGKLFRNSVNKFRDDRLFTKVNNDVYVLDGVILNKKELFEKYKTENGLLDLFNKISVNESFYTELRGTFAGCYLKEHEDNFFLFTNHIGDKEVFYYHHNPSNTLYFGTDFNTLVKLINIHLDKKFEINVNAAYSLLTHSHVLCNETLFKDIYRLTPGHYLKFSGNEITKCLYFKLDNSPKKIEKKIALKELDRLFRQAIRRSFEKDLEYGYKHLVALSGGLDSRMTAWVAHEMGYTNMTNYTFSQTEYLDEKIPKKITDYLKTEWIFKSLDNGTYLYRYSDEAVRLSGGRSQNSTIAHTLSTLKNINFKDYGLVHTGQLGDVIIGTFYDKGIRRKFTKGSGAYSKLLITNVEYSLDNAFHIEDQELFKLYNRGLTGVNIGLKPMFQYTETVSPFLDVDFLEFCLSLPLEYRSGHSIYIEWINGYYPKAAEYIYEKVKGKINRKIITVQGVPIPWTSIHLAFVKLLRNKLGFKYGSKNHMHPIDYWYKNNSKLNNYYKKVFSDINLIKDEELRENCNYLFKKGGALEKDQVVTFIVFIRQMLQYLL